MADPYANFASPAQDQAAIQASALPLIPGSTASPAYAADPYAGFSAPAISPGEDALLSTPTGLNHFVAGAVGAAGDAANAGTSAAEWLIQKGGHALGIDDSKLGGFTPHAPAPTSADVNTAIQSHVTGPYHQPQTTAGHYAETIASLAPAGLAGAEGLGGRIAMSLAPGIASETGGQAAQAMNLGPGWETALRVLGGLAGTGGVAGVQGVLRAPSAALGAAAGNVTDEQIAAAQTLRQQAAARGLDLTLAEAVQQVTNNGTNLGRMQRVIEGTREGGERTSPYFAQRPDQVRTAVLGHADTIAPHTDQPSMIGVRAQDAATGALDRGRQTVNSVAGPDYAALPGQTMEPDAYAALVANPSYRIALADLRAHPELGPPVAHLPDNSLAVVNEVQKRLATSAEAARGTPLVPGDNQLAGLRTGAMGQADELARTASEPYGGQYGAARDTVRDLSQRYVDPMKAGPVGTISQSADVPTHTGALYPVNPLEGAPAETAQAVRVLNGVEPGVADDLTRQHLVNALNTSSRDLRAGPNQYVGSKFANAVAGQPEQAATLDAGVSALPGGQAKAADLDQLLEALRATGKRQPPGSMTAFNTEDLKNLHVTPFANAIGKLGDPLEWGKGIGDIINRANYHRNVSSLVDMLLASPDETAAILQRARRAAPSNSLLPALLMDAGSGHRQ